MLNVITSISRDERKFYRNKVINGSLPLFMLGPKNFDGYAGRTGYFFCAKTDTGFVMISKLPAANRDAARKEAKLRFGRTASEYRNPTPKKPKEAKADKLAA